MPSPFSKPKKTVSTRRPLLKKKSKLSFKLIAPALAMVITLAGAGIATMLAQKSQENRGQAAGCNPNVDQPRCSDNDGYWWKCDHGDNPSYQKSVEVCKPEIVNPEQITQISAGDIPCDSVGKLRCFDNKVQRCGSGQWTDNGGSCGITPAGSPTCTPNEVACIGGKYHVCRQVSSNILNENKYEWNRRPWSSGSDAAHDEDCGNGFEIGNGSGSTQGDSSQPTLPTNSDPVGYLDEVTCSQAVGWACDADVTTKIDVHFYSGSNQAETFIGSAVAGLLGGNSGDYDAIAAMGGCSGDGARRFSFELPSNLASGTNIYAMAINRDKDGNGGGHNPLLIGAPRPVCQSTRTTQNVAPTYTCNADNTVTISWRLAGIMEKFILRMDKANASKCNGTEWFCAEANGTGDQYVALKTSDVCTKDGSCSVTRPIVAGSSYNGASLQWVLQNGSTGADANKMGDTGGFTCGSPRAKILGIF